MPNNKLAASNRSCNIPLRPISTPSCSPCCGKPSSTPSLQNHGVRFMMGHARQNTKSTYECEGLTSHFTRTTEKRRMCVQSWHARKACSRHASSHQAVGLACKAMHRGLFSLQAYLKKSKIWGRFLAIMFKNT